MSLAQSPGRLCPLHYRYDPRSFAVAAKPDLSALDVLYVVGGLYGNSLALAEVLRLFDQEVGRKALVFNGDFHWFDVDKTIFSEVQKMVLVHHATRGNVETELASQDGGVDGSSDQVGCGCAYPDWVDDAVVDRSNQILSKLRQAATADDRAVLAALPMWLRADVAGAKVAVVHGDASSLAGWGFAQEHLSDPDQQVQVQQWFEDAQVDAFACTHTCLPVFQGFEGKSGANGRWVLNNGSAGMPNFKGDRAGHFTRIAAHPHPESNPKCHIRLGSAFVDLVALPVDPVANEQAFLRQWPAASEAHRSYYDRICLGPNYQQGQVVRDST